jgi:hypothetical protein
VIVRAYLGVDLSVASAQDWLVARSRWGDPLGVPTQSPDGSIRQAFGAVVWEHPAGAIVAHLAILGPAIAAAQLVPSATTNPEPGPRLVPVPPDRPSAVFGFVIAFVVALAGWFVVERLLGFGDIGPRPRASDPRSSEVDLGSRQ